MALSVRSLARSPSLFLSFAAMLAFWCAFLWWRGAIPEWVPVWWNFDASPRYWGPRWLCVPALPILQFLVPYIACVVVSRDKLIDKHSETSQQKVGVIIILLSGFLFFVAIEVLLDSFRSADHYFRSFDFVNCLSLFFFIGAGWHMPYVELNYSIGILTPWTLRSGIVWRKTHAQAGYVLPGFGLALVVSAFICGIFVPHVSLLALALVSGIPPFLYLGVYSWIESGSPESETLISSSADGLAMVTRIP